MLHWIARLAIAAPRRIIAVAALGMVALGILGVPVANSLSASGLQDPIQHQPGRRSCWPTSSAEGNVQLLIIVSVPDGSTVRPAPTGEAIVDQLQPVTARGERHLPVDDAATGRCPLVSGMEIRD